MHAEAERAGDTDWRQIVGLYDVLLRAQPSPVVELNRAVAIAMGGLMVQSVASGEWAGALFLAGFAALFAWQVGGFVRRNKPLTYSFGEVPQTLLP